jgi:hypothetical protein
VVAERSQSRIVLRVRTFFARNVSFAGPRVFESLDPPVIETSRRAQRDVSQMAPGSADWLARPAGAVRPWPTSSKKTASSAAMYGADSASPMRNADGWRGTDTGWVVVDSVRS